MQSPKPVGLRFLLIDDEGDGAARLFDEVDDLCVGIEYLSIVEDAFHWDFLTKPQNKTPDNPSRSSGIYDNFQNCLRNSRSQLYSETQRSNDTIES